MILLVTLASAACPVARSLPELRDALAEVESSWGRDMEGFASGVQAVREIVPCVGEALAPPDAGAVHRAEGLSAFSRRDMESARRSFAAARAADPNYTLSSSLAPEGNPLRAEWEGAVPSVASGAVPAATSLVSFVDGGLSQKRATDRPAVIQYVDADGRAKFSALVEGNVAVPVPQADPKIRRVPWGWVGATVASGLAGGVLLGAAYAADEEYQAAKSKSEADLLREPVNTLAGASVGCAALVVGFGAVAVVRGVF